MLSCFGLARFALISLILDSCLFWNMWFLDESIGDSQLIKKRGKYFFCIFLPLKDLFCYLLFSGTLQPVVISLSETPSSGILLTVGVEHVVGRKGKHTNEGSRYRLLSTVNIKILSYVQDTPARAV